MTNATIPSNPFPTGAFDLGILFFGEPGQYDNDQAPLVGSYVVHGHFGDCNTISSVFSSKILIGIQLGASGCCTLYSDTTCLKKNIIGYPVTGIYSSRSGYGLLNVNAMKCSLYFCGPAASDNRVASTTISAPSTTPSTETGPATTVTGPTRTVTVTTGGRQNGGFGMFNVLIDLEIWLLTPSYRLWFRIWQ